MSNDNCIGLTVWVVDSEDMNKALEEFCPFESNWDVPLDFVQTEIRNYYLIDS